MSWDGLRNFFIMHGENIDRKEGRAGRGIFGTGKSAAFGIANVLRVTSVHHKKLSVVELHRQDIEKMEGGDDVPVRTIKKEEATNDSNGTLIEIEEVQLRKIDPNTIIRHIERHISHWPDATVFVNHHECQFIEPLVSNEYRFQTSGHAVEEIIGDVELIVKVAKAPLEEELQGIVILSKGVWHETTLAGAERKPFAKYIFGEIDVPAIQEDDSPIPPFDISRSMQLNKNNAVVMAVFAFVGEHVDQIRHELENADRERRKAEDAKKLEKEAESIAEIINSDFTSWRDRIKQMQARMSGGSDLIPEEGPNLAEGENFIFGGDEPAEIVDDTGDPGHGEGNAGGGGEIPEAGPQVAPGEPESPEQGKKSSTEKQKKRARGGFSVDFLNMGSDEARAKYERENRTIYVNLDHPQIFAALDTSGTDDPVFRRLAYEVAFAEYAIALASEMAAAGYYLDTSDPIVDIRETLNRVARNAAHLYAAKQ